MSQKRSLPRFAWQPFTPRGVAAFSICSWRRFLVVQLVAAALCTWCIFWFLQTAWLPAVKTATRALPEEGAMINQGRLIYPTLLPVRLAETRHLAVWVDVTGTGETGHIADLELIFRERELRICSLLGCRHEPYDTRFRIAFNSREIEAWWGARSWILISAGLTGLVVVFLLAWGLLALFFAPVLWTVAYFADLQLTWAGSYRVAAAGLLPGAALLSTGILLYGAGAIDLIRLSLFFGMHLLMPWLYLAGVLFFLPKREDVLGLKNPFAPIGTPPTRRSPKNPFGGDAGASGGS